MPWEISERVKKEIERFVCLFLGPKFFVTHRSSQIKFGALAAKSHWPLCNQIVSLRLGRLFSELFGLVDVLSFLKIWALSLLDFKQNARLSITLTWIVLLLCVAIILMSIIITFECKLGIAFSYTQANHELMFFQIRSFNFWHDFIAVNMILVIARKGRTKLIEQGWALQKK